HLFSQVLKLNQIGINDNFFEIGGHSLLATQLISRIRTHLQIELPLRTLFSAPTVAELASLIQAIKQQNLQLNFPPIVKRENQNELPLSYAQTRLWFIDQLQPNSALYNIPSALRIAGRLPIATLEKSLREIIQRHEVLRTNFITIDGEANQIIHPENNGFLSLIDLQHLGTKEQEITVQELIQEQTIKPFDLAKDSLIRITLINKSETEHILIICMHHIISDGWSIGVFVQELAALYNADIQNQPSPLTPLPIQYADFAIWQREWLSGEVLETQLSYWKQQLADTPALLSLPTDRQRPAVQTYTGAHQKFALSSDLTEKLTQLSQEQGVTLFMTLLAGFNTLLYRYTGQSDIVVGSPIANRNHSEIEGLIGFFVNTLVLRTDLAENPSFTELIHRVKEVSLAAYTHQDLPFEMLVEAVAPSRDLSYSPLFQVMFVLQNAPLSELELSGLTLSPQELEMPIAKFDLTLSMENSSTGLVGWWEYNTDLFDGSTIERMIGHFQTLLAAIVENPQTPISQLPILTTTEQQQLLVEWNDTQTDYPIDQCLHQLFEQQVKKTPDAVAVIFEDQQLTYSQLNDRANQLAHYLRSLGVGADVLVGICVERSIDMIVGLLGILKAGGAYLPLDPDYPQERLQFMLDDAQVKVLLTQQRLLEKLNVTQENLICLDRDWQIIQQWSQNNPISEVLATNLAYVIYTSGSTGQPKGVLITHQGLLNLVFWHQSTFSIAPSDKATQLAGTAFDAAVWELWPYLSAGASVYLVTSDTLYSPTDLRDWLIAKEISITFVPTPLAEKLLLLEWNETSALRTMLVGGDRLHNYPSLSVPFSVVNNYGPTENTVVTTSGLVVPKAEEFSASPSIGRPIANTQVYILDSYLQPVPVGVPGELHIGGAGLARGYLNRKELTQEKFIPHPFDNNERVYKTGDLARYLPDGNIEYLGRIDNQVKIRGFRIELGEIEALLSQCPQVQAAVVIAREDIPGDKRLVAYIVPLPDTALTVSELREFLKAQVPEYMIPSAFVILESLPLTPNGKVDRRALPKPDFHSEQKDKYAAPRNSVEEILTQIWAEVLNLNSVGIYDNFFELGGYSLLAIQLVSRIRSQLQVEVPLQSLFAAPTVADLATIIAATLDSSAPITTDTQVDLEAEAVLDPSIQIENVPFTYTNEPKKIFLTGASGFLGSHLLYELLEQTQADVYCLIRSADEKQAYQKLLRQMESLQIWQEAFSSRIVPVVGDLSQNLLGLSRSNFQDLAAMIDVIYHNGALVNFVYPYSTLKPANVLGTQEVVRLASEIKLKPVHYVSTLSVFASPAYSGKIVLESDPLEHSKDMNNGYAQTKWVADRLMMLARDRGLPVCIYRPARILGHSQTGISPPDDFWSTFILGFIHLGMAIALDNAKDNIIPVDYMSRAIVHLSQQKESLGKAFHLLNSHYTPIADLYNWIRALGYPLKEISYEEWRSHLIRTNQTSSNKLLQSLVAMAPEPNNQTTEQNQPPEFDFTNALSGLAGTDLVFPAIEPDLIAKYLSNLLGKTDIFLKKQ
ncbi:amino acid adenylation domain-containing protein, partial [Floridanema evergladense]